MEYFVVGITAFVISGISFFSGFGLGTVLLPVFAMFFPVPAAVMLTAIVHLSTNLFKFFLLGRAADKKALWQFGVPAILAAIAGARLLLWFSGLPVLATYTVGGYSFQVMTVKLVIAVLMIVFALFELLPGLSGFAFERKFLPLGGLLSGFLGGLSGHQGALRSAFLINLGLSKQSFVATGAVISCLVDMSRLFVYGASFTLLRGNKQFELLITAVVWAFLGAFFGNRLLKKITMRVIQLVVAGMLFVIAIALAAGVI
jgi:uncharacterized protein